MWPGCTLYWWYSLTLDYEVNLLKAPVSSVLRQNSCAIHLRVAVCILRHMFYFHKLLFAESAGSCCYGMLCKMRFIYTSWYFYFILYPRSTKYRMIIIDVHRSTNFWTIIAVLHVATVSVQTLSNLWQVIHHFTGYVSIQIFKIKNNMVFLLLYIWSGWSNTSVHSVFFFCYFPI